MQGIIDGLKACIENPDDTSNFPELISKLEEKQQSIIKKEEEYQERIISLQQANHNLLSKIPIHDGEPSPGDDGDKEVTFEQAQEELVKAMNNIGGYNNE